MMKIINIYYIPLFIVCAFLVSSYGYASGAFIPNNPVGTDNQYNLGKVLVRSHAQKDKMPMCLSCHSTYKRSQLRRLSYPVGEFLSKCDLHTPCYNELLSEEQLEAISIYFKKRYNIK